MVYKKVIHGFDLPNESLSRDYGLVSRYDKTWRSWLQTEGKVFDHSIPTNGIIESIEKICSSNEYKRFVIIQDEVEFYSLILRYHSKNFTVIKAGDWNRLQEDDLICLSMPFSFNGSIPDWYQDLCNYIEDKKINMFLDGAYLGTINKKLYIPDNCILFATSISKCFNASGLRAGILFYDKLPSLFKAKFLIANYNYTSMRKAIELLNIYDYYYMHRNYWHIQKLVCATHNIQPADSVILGYDESRHCIPDLYAKT